MSYLDLPTERLHISTNLKQIIKDADYLIFAIPAAFLNDTLHGITPKDFKDKTVISAIKGIVPEYHSTITTFFQKTFQVPMSNLGVISGPCHSEEVAMEKLSFLTLAIQDHGKAEFLQTHFKAPFIRLALSRDIVGVEYASVLKNIMAIANGIAVGLGYGDNFQSVLIVNAIQEAKRFLDKINTMERDFNDSAYLGDLIVTCYSQFSRNRTFGNMIGKGYSPKFARIEMKMVAEGYYAVKGMMEINKEFGVYMPVTEAVYNILYEGISPYMEMKILSEKFK